MGRAQPPACEESVACNLIPMIDIMFLLLLFFMLGADMSAREMVDVILPLADQVKDQEKTVQGKHTTVNIYHREGSCAVYAAGGVCRQADHWGISIHAQDFTPDTIVKGMKEYADEDREPAIAGQKALSAMLITIRADAGAPYLAVQRVIEGCSANGIYKIEVGAAHPAE